MIWVHVEGVDDVIVSGDAITETELSRLITEAEEGAFLILGNLINTVAEYVAVPIRNINAIYINDESI